ncbi:LysE family transporter [Fictibacillus nanhaiensis]|uniref:LysE family transporter n=2 Tax=Fictibacillus nanhaiensis TaxID=742169 RepID=A0ABS2ZQA4_9BACL|nr:LysE family transporter [Fictibacillus nanhaiensis]
MGISIAAPVGPIGVLCMQRTLTQGRVVGIVSGLGAACADFIYGLIAGLGLTMVSQFIMSRQSWIQLIGGLFLFYLGLKILCAKATPINGTPRKSSLSSAFFTTFLQTLTNPMTILSFAAIFAGLGIVNTHTSAISSTTLIVGIFCGSAAWWIFLTTTVSMMRRRMNQQHMAMINVISGIIICLFGMFSLIRLMIGS